MSSSSDRFINIQISTHSRQRELLVGLDALLERELICDGQLDIRSRVDDTDRPYSLRLDVTLPPNAEVWSGIETWRERGLLSRADLSVDLRLWAHKSALLAGLNVWVELGLLDRADVLHLGRSRLACPVNLSQSSATTFGTAAANAPAPPRQSPKIAARSSAPAEKASHRWGRVLQSLVAELSVLWLLLLGAFMVVISSGVLAASQWERFPAFVQYGILWVYTLGFWAGSYWAALRPRLRLTSQALRIVTLLLVPLNFLAMDSFGLWRSPLQWIVVAIASVTLIGLTVQVFRARSPQSLTRAGPIVPLINHVGLSVIHVGWGVTGFPIVATYIGIVGTAFLSLYDRRAQASESEAISESEAAEPQSPNPFGLDGAVLVYAIGILLLRSLVIAQIPIAWLGLAIGLCGWLAIQQASPLESPDEAVAWSGWERVGSGLLLLGWFVSVFTLPWMAFLVSGLMLWVLALRVLRIWHRNDLGVLLLVGVQMLWLAWRSVPWEARRSLVDGAAQLTGTENEPIALLSVALLPYLGVLLVLTDALMQSRKRDLAQFVGRWAFVLGCFLSLLSLVSPALRVVNFGVSGMTLGAVTFRQHHRNLERDPQRQISANSLRSLATLTHLYALLASFSIVDWALPTLGLVPWAAIGLAAMVLEGRWSMGRSPDPLSPSFAALLRQSSWPFCLALAGLTYLSLLANAIASANNGLASNFAIASPAWSAMWFVAPLTFTGLIARDFDRRWAACKLSVVALLFLQALTLGAPEVRWLSLLLATGLMVANTHALRSLFAATVTVGFGLGVVGVTLARIAPQLSDESWILAIAIVTFALWIIRHGTARRGSEELELYGRASDGWAIGLCGAELCFLLSYLVYLLDGFTWVNFNAPVQYPVMALVVMTAAAYRSWQTLHPEVLKLSVAAILIAQLPFLLLPDSCWFTLSAGLMLMGVQTRFLQHWVSAAITLGLGWLLGVSLLWLTVGWFDDLYGWLPIFATVPWMLWIVRRVLLNRSSKLAIAYCRAADAWGIAIGFLTLSLLTFQSWSVYYYDNSASLLAVMAAAIALGGLLFRTWNHPANWTIYALGWSLELLVLEVLGLTGRSIVALTIANIALGMLTQVVGDWWQRRSDEPHMLSSWHVLPLIYAGLGASLRWNLFADWTGLSSLGLVAIAIGIGRRNSVFRPLLYLGIAGLTLSAYELLLFQVQGLLWGDRLLAMATLTATIVYAYRILTPWLTGYLRLSPEALRFVSHLHWGVGSLLLVAALSFPVEVYKLPGLGAAFFLTRYAIAQGRHHRDRRIGEVWVYLGLLEAAGTIAYVAATVPALSEFAGRARPWAGAIAAWMGATIYLQPWQNWGWSQRPWRLTAVLAPPLTVSFVLLHHAQPPHVFSLLAMAGYYGWLSWQRHQSRWLYASVVAVDWAIWLLLPASLHFAKTCLVGVSIIGVTGFEPACREETGRSLRHYLRCLGAGIIGFDSLRLYSQPGFIPGLVGITGIFLGLGFRIRAFLYVGTATFLAIASYQMVLSIFAYPMLKWAIGLLLGLVFIWIAASFETRRQQIAIALQNWSFAFEGWD